MRWWDREFNTDLLGLFFIVAFSAMAGAGVPKDPNPQITKDTGCRIGQRLNWLIDRVRPKDWEALAGIIKNELNRNTAVNDAVDFAVHQMKAGVK